MPCRLWILSNDAEPFQPFVDLWFHTPGLLLGAFALDTDPFGHRSAFGVGGQGVFLSAMIRLMCSALIFLSPRMIFFPKPKRRAMAMEI